MFNDTSSNVHYTIDGNHNICPCIWSWMDTEHHNSFTICPSSSLHVGVETRSEGAERSAIKEKCHASTVQYQSISSSTNSMCRRERKNAGRKGNNTGSSSNQLFEHGKYSLYVKNFVRTDALTDFNCWHYVLSFLLYLWLSEALKPLQYTSWDSCVSFMHERKVAKKSKQSSSCIFYLSASLSFLNIHPN